MDLEIEHSRNPVKRCITVTVSHPPHNVDHPAGGNSLEKVAVLRVVRANHFFNLLLWLSCKETVSTMNRPVRSLTFFVLIVIRKSKSKNQKIKEKAYTHNTTDFCIRCRL